MFTTHATLAALFALSSGQWIQPRIFDQPNLRAGNGRVAVDHPYFSWDPFVDGTTARINGVPTVELTYTRTGSMFCQQADGGGTILSADQPCIAQSGILLEGAATNAVPRSQEFDNAGWVRYNGGGGTAPVKTADYGTAPDGTNTADRLEVSATTAPSGYSAIRWEPNVGASGLRTGSVFVKGTASSGTIDLCQRNQANTGYKCDACSYTASAWTRCTTTESSAADLDFWIGHVNSTSSASDVLIWGAQVETGSVATSYTPTTSAAATRGAVTAANFAIDASSYSSGTFCYGVNVVSGASRSLLPFGQRGVGALIGESADFRFFTVSNAVKMSRAFVGNMSGGAASGSVLDGSRMTFEHLAGTDVQTTYGGVVGAGTLGGAVSTSGYTLKLFADTESQPYPYGFVSGVTFDPRPTRCR